MSTKAVEWLTREQFSARFNIPKRTLEGQFSARTGPYAEKLGRAIRYPLDERGCPLPWPVEKEAA